MTRIRPIRGIRLIVIGNASGRLGAAAGVGIIDLEEVSMVHEAPNRMRDNLTWRWTRCWDHSSLAIYSK